MGVFIDDGFTLDAELPALGRHEAIKFRYRPLLPPGRSAWLNSTSLDKNPPFSASAEMLVAQLVSWDAPARKGTGTEPISVDALAHLPPARFEKLISIVAMYDGTEAEKNS